MTEAFVAHLWQSTLFAAAAWILAILLRRNGAHVRYWIWFAASLKFVVPFSLFVWLGSFLQWHSPAPRTPVPWVAVLAQAAQPLALPPTVREGIAQNAAARSSQYMYMGWAVPALWLAGCALLAMVWLLRYARVSRLRNQAEPIRIAGCPIPVLSVSGPIEPGVFGIFRPVLLFPAGILQTLSPAQLGAVVAHELCHARRKDNLTSAMHVAVQAAFWFHPLIWWLGARLVEERERACDEAVLRLGAEARDYAEGILNVCKLCVESPVPCVAGVGGSNLKQRIEHIMRGRPVLRVGFSGKAAIAIAAVSAVVIPLAIGAVFEIADVHVSNTQHALSQFPGNAGSIIRDGKYINRDATMLDLIEEAYGIADGVSGGPSWVSSDLFDVIARVPEGATPAQVKEMLQALLAERFRLVVRKDTHPAPRYVLSVGAGGSKLRPTSGPRDQGCRPDRTETRAAAGEAANVKAICHNLTSQQIADTLHQIAGGYLNHDVIDAAKLDGAWDFELEWTAANQLDKSRGGISIFDAVEKLGLKLELKNVPVPGLVIESVMRRPADNPPGVSKSLGLAVARFEAASVKMADPNDQGYGIGYSGGSQVRAHGTLRELIGMAMQIRTNAMADLIVGLPKSADAQKWAITAKLPVTGEGAPSTGRGRPAPPPFSVALEMMRGLLADSFELKTHIENREITVLALMVDRKPKMTRADDSERDQCRLDPMAPRPFPNLGFMVRCENTSMAEFAQNLETATGYLDHPVVDATGLDGGWDFVIGFTPKRLENPPQAAAGAVPDPPEAPDVSIYDALRKELGLKLVNQKRSVPVTVVDQVDEKPLE